MVKYVIFERRMDNRNQAYLLSVGVLEAGSLQEAVNNINDNFDNYVDSSYAGGEICLERIEQIRR